MQRLKTIFVLGASVLVLGTTIVLAGAMQPSARAETQLEIAKIFWEYNSSANDLGVQVSLDGEDWKTLKIENPDGKVIFDVRGKGPYKQLGLTELFFEGAEPTLDEFPLRDLLDLFPEGEYDFEGKTVDGEKIEGQSEFSHAIPAGPDVFSSVGAGNFLQISWTAVDGTPLGFPDADIQIVRYQVLIDESFDMKVPSSVLSVTIPPEYVGALGPGEHQFEVLAIDRTGNQTITEGSFEL
jgi:hypothetical protein